MHSLTPAFYIAVEEHPREQENSREQNKAARLGIAKRSPDSAKKSGERDSNGYEWHSELPPVEGEFSI